MVPDIKIYEHLKSKILSLTSEEDFTLTAFEVFYYQFHRNKLYRDFCNHLHRNPKNISRITDIPFLPISFYKSHKVLSSTYPPETVFKSSGTTGMNRSMHYVSDIELYKAAFRKGFKKFYGSPKDYTILALLPSYVNQGQSSLVYMTQQLIQDTANPMSGFYLDNYSELFEKLSDSMAPSHQIILLGVTYALLDLIENYSINSGDNFIVMETGGMKGRRKEMIRPELHQQLSKGFGVKTIHSEYGMTELLSQAFSKGNGLFFPSDSMRILIRDTNDPLSFEKTGKSGGINVVDLANINSCSFIATQDLGKLYPDGSFEILGRFDNSDIRGCNLLVQ